MKRFLVRAGLGTLAAGWIFAGCSPKSDYGAFNPEPQFAVEDVFQYSREQEIPKLDLVFVMDNSKSMHTHLTNLSENIEKFTEKFNTESIDLRVGVVTVFDSTRYKVYSSKQDARIAEDRMAFNRANGEANRRYSALYPEDRGEIKDLGFEMYMLSYPGLYSADYRYAYYEDLERGNIVLPLGIMRPVRVGEGLMDVNRSFLTNNDPAFLDSLKHSLLLTSDFHKLAQKESDGWAQYGAPVLEEVFSVVRGIVDPKINSVENRGFLREDAHLAVVIVTDAEDSTKGADGKLMDPDTAAQALLNFKQDTDKLSVYGVLSIVSEGIESCEADAFARPEREVFTPVRPRRIESFIRKLQGSTYSLCSPDFGSELAAIGSDLVRKVYEQNDFELNHIPTSISDIKVYVDGQLNDSWIYNNNRHAISLNAIRQSQATVRVEYFTPNPAMLAGDYVSVDGE